MSREIILFLATVRLAAAAQFTPVWQLGTDDERLPPFGQENYNSNSEPGSAAVKDDDYYFAGTYPAPVGTLAVDEAPAHFERAITSGDPRNRIHFALTAAAAANSRFRITVDLCSGGAPVPGFSRHDVRVTCNGQLVGVRNGITWDTTLVFVVPGSNMATVAGANTLQIERTGGTAGGYVGLDYLKLEVEVGALTDADGDGMPLWFEKTYSLSDTTAADALLDPDGDGLNNRAEFLAGTNPTAPDSDNDGLTDSRELTLGTNPLKSDTDGDGLADGAETTSSPLLADTDGDTYPDNVELEQRTNPASAPSVPFNFPGAISLQFVSERVASAVLAAGQPAGYFRFPNWNASDLLPTWSQDGTVLSGTKSALKNHRGQPTTAAASWTYHVATNGQHQGPGDEQLLDGMIRTETTAALNMPVTVSLTGISYPSYDLMIYVGRTYPGARGVVSLGGNAATNRYFKDASAPPFLGWQEITATTEAAILPGNYVRYRQLTGATQSFSLLSLDSNEIGVHGVQIIQTGTDADGDGMSDALEVENRFNPMLADATADPDADGMTNQAEISAGTDPYQSDSDHDGLADGAEVNRGTSPLLPDSDTDGLTDGDEVNATPFPSNPLLADSDSDGFTDKTERSYSSNPLSASSTPPPVPVWNAATRTWLWRIDNCRVLWNHPQSMLGAIEYDDTMLCEAVADINQSGWTSQIGMGIRYVKGKLVHRFRANSGVFGRVSNVNNGFWNTDSSATPVDRTLALGFSGAGPADESAPLRLEFSATQPNPAVNVWTIKFLIADLTNPASPVTLATYSDSAAVAKDASLLTGDTVWKNQDGVVGRMDLETETGVRALISASPLATADSDNDGMPDAWETTHLFNPSNAADAATDFDADGLSNLKEFLAGTNPRDSDSDDDGAADGMEVLHHTNPLSVSSVPAWFSFPGTIDDSNNDGLSDAWMLWSGSKPRQAAADDDGDGMTNLQESRAGTDPDDAKSKFDLMTWRSNDSLVLSWTDLPFKTSRVETSSTLTAWQTATALPASSIIGGRRQVTLPGVFTPGANSRFYRAGVLPLDTDGDGVEDWVEAKVLGSSSLSRDSLGQSLVKSNGQTLAGDAMALLERLQGSAPSGGIPGSTAVSKPSLVSASRFLMQASFGPTSQAIQEVRDLGYAAWIDRQLTLPPSLQQPYIKQIKADGAGPRLDPTYNFNELDQFVHGNNVTTPFARNAISGEDQLRQRVAFALSQILVVSRRDANLEEKTEAITNYYDMLSRHALGNYGDLLKAVTFHPTMGWYLSHVGNQKADPAIPRYPDENYAREIMQLFTIGLWELNPDGSRKLNANSEPIPTYDNGDITELARVFTGLYFVSPYGWGSGGWDDAHFLKPMVMYPIHHDFEAKRLLRGAVMPAREETEANGNQDISDAVATLFQHPNTPPFVCRQLIQFLVTDNPSPGYIRRIQDIFVNDGTGVRGNLAAVVKALLLDPEARSLPLSASCGKVREPVIRTMHLGRLMRLVEANPKFVWWNWSDGFYSSSIQEPMNSPSVFNFYTPVYQAPGAIRNAGLVSPGFQIINTYSAVSFPNLLWNYLHDGFKSGGGWEFPLDYRDALLLAENSVALVDHIDLLVCAGSMTGHTRSALLAALANTTLTQKDRVALALWTAMISPEGVVQK
jgi:uncharacterized protein (DUF1800 family)